GLRVAVSFFLGLARLMLALLCSGLLGSPRGSALRGVLDPALPCTLTGGLRLVELNAALPFLQVRTGQGLQNLAVRLIQDGGRDGLDDRAPRLLRRQGVQHHVQLIVAEAANGAAWMRPHRSEGG